MPEYRRGAAADAEAELTRCAPLVFAGEVRELHEQLARACQGNGFLLMGGDCAESFAEHSVNNVRDTFRIILQMALVLTYGGGVPIVKVGRMAGQFAKPRSSNTETVDGVELPCYRGDNVNGEEFTLEARTPDPSRMVKAYHQCAQTLNLLRGFSVGGYADISRLHAWNLDFVAQTQQGSQYRALATKVDESLRFMKAIGVNTQTQAFTQTQFYTAHECLLLPYEQALTRQDSTTGRWYDCSAHLLWVGERTRQMDNAHLEFVRGIGNPLGVKVSDKCTPEQLLEMVDRSTRRTRRAAHRHRAHGRRELREHLPGLVRIIQREGRNVLWISDPVHGNGFKAPDGYKTRDFVRIRDELRAFFDVHDALGTHAGGVHRDDRPGRDGVRRRRLPARRARGPQQALLHALRPAPQRPPVARARVPHRVAHAPQRRPAAARLGAPAGLRPDRSRVRGAVPGRGQAVSARSSRERATAARAAPAIAPNTPALCPTAPIPSFSVPPLLIPHSKQAPPHSILPPYSRNLWP